MVPRSVLRLVVAVLLGICAGQALWADVVVLDDGRRIEGIVLGQSPIEVTVRLDTGAIVRFPRRRVRSIQMADWRYYVRKGDEAKSGSDALECYLKARELNPSAPGINAKIAEARRRVEQEQRRRQDDQERRRREAEEARIVARYQRLMEAVRPDAARELLEREIADKPWLCRPRILLADFYARRRTPDATIRYVQTLAGLIANDPDSYYSLYAPRVIEAAMRLLHDQTASAVMPFERKDQLLGYVAPLIGPRGDLVAPSQFKQRRADLASSPLLTTAAKIEFLKKVCLERPGDRPSVGSESATLLRYAAMLKKQAGGEALLRQQIEVWSQQARSLVQSGQSAKASALSEVILVLDPRNAVARDVALSSLLEEAKRLAGRNLFDLARGKVEAAEQIAPNSPRVAAAKARLLAAVASSKRASGDLESAAKAIGEAVKASSRLFMAEDAELRKVGRLVKTQQVDLFEELLATARKHEKENDFLTAYKYANLALETNPGVIGRLRATRAVRSYASAWREEVTKNIEIGAKIDAYEGIATLRAQGQGAGLWDKQLEDKVDSIIKQAKKKAQDYATKNDMYNVFLVLGRLEPLYSDADTKALLQKARHQVVDGGRLDMNFFSSMWQQGSTVRLGLAAQALEFQGRGIQVAESNLPPGAVRIEHTNADQYLIRVNRAMGQDVVTVRVLGPDKLLLESYSTPATGTGAPQVVNFGTVIVRMGQFAGPSAAPAPGAPSPTGPQSPPRPGTLGESAS